MSQESSVIYLTDFVEYLSETIRKDRPFMSLVFICDLNYVLTVIVQKRTSRRRFIFSTISKAKVKKLTDSLNPLTGSVGYVPPLLFRNSVFRYAERRIY